MTPEEMGKALGPGWEPKLVGTGAFLWHDFVRGRVRVSESAFGWAVEVDRLPAATAEQVPAVAHLLVAAERIAAGAEVGGHLRRETMRVRPGQILVGGTRTGRGYRPGDARAHALDLLRAADEAEAQP